MPYFYFLNLPQNETLTCTTLDCIGNCFGRLYFDLCACVVVDVIVGLFVKRKLFMQKAIKKIGVW